MVGVNCPVRVSFRRCPERKSTVVSRHSKLRRDVDSLVVRPRGAAKKAGLSISVRSV